MNLNTILLALPFFIIHALVSRWLVTRAIQRGGRGKWYTLRYFSVYFPFYKHVSPGDKVIGLVSFAGIIYAVYMVINNPPANF